MLPSTTPSPPLFINRSCPLCTDQWQVLNFSLGQWPLTRASFVKRHKSRRSDHPLCTRSTRLPSIIHIKSVNHHPSSPHLQLLNTTTKTNGEGGGLGAGRVSDLVWYWPDSDPWIFKNRIRIQKPLSWKFPIYFMIIFYKKLLPFSFFDGPKS